MIRFIHEIGDEEVGGKAHGLRLLYNLGLNVPDAFVMIYPTKDSIDDTLIRENLAKLGHGPKAVRSSAISEDGKDASFAGQFETFLNLNSFDEIRKAIIRCIEAVESDRVKSYSGNLLNTADLRISVILQNMVEAKIAGVVFSANPVNQRRDKIIINAIAGSGEELVSGKKDAHHYEIFRSGSNIDRETEKNGILLGKSQLEEIIAGTKKAEKILNHPADLEWAIDAAGKLHWLQVRPVTTLQEEHFNELDTVKDESRDVWTLGNIGEMMPGTATPLTYSVSARAIDHGMVILAQKGGAYHLKDWKENRYIHMFYNRLFINMSHMMDYPKRIWLNKAEDVQFALSGKLIPGLTAVPESILPLRIMNFIRQQYYTGRAPKYLKKLKILTDRFHVETKGSLAEIHKSLEYAREQLGIAFGYHLLTSAQSGTLYSAIIRILAGNKRVPSAEDHHKATILYSEIPGIESADAVNSLDLFTLKIQSDKDFAYRFIHAEKHEALRLLNDNVHPEISRSFHDFLQRHGHRCIRESELREKTWEEDPLQLIHLVQTTAGINRSNSARPDSEQRIQEVLKKVPPVNRMIIRAILPGARNAVARREISKSLSIKIISIIRKGYQVLAEKMVKSGLLEDTDQIYFLTHEEIGRLIRAKDKSLVQKASRRRLLLVQEEKLEFPEINFGIPEPTEQEESLLPGTSELVGTPVSSGITEGKVRIIDSPLDAAGLEKGEIMIASFTDIGWTPYFSIIAGLITEIGSPLSHGAVVAREYGLPAIVGVKGARKFFKNGDRVRLNGNTGIIEKLNQAHTDHSSF